MRPPQEPPSYGYEGGFTYVTQCTSCGNTGRHEECSFYRPCKHCGGAVTRNESTAVWIKPKYKGFLFWQKVVEEGYWDIL